MSFLDKIFFGDAKTPDAAENSITVRSEPDGTPDLANIADLTNSTINQVLAYVPKSEQDAIREYRKLALNAEVDEALQEIVNESFNITQNQKAMELAFDADTQLPASLQKKITQAFDRVYHDLFNFDDRGAWLFRKWYVDGRLYLHKVLSKDKKRIQALQVIDPLQIRRLKNTHADKQGLLDLSKEEVVYVYVPRSDDIAKLWGLKVTDDYTMGSHAVLFPEQAIAYADSGILHPQHNFIIGHLNKAILPFNNMKMMEDAMVIYRVARSPARRVFYVGTGNMPKNKAEQFMRDLIAKMRNKLSYNAETGTIVDRTAVLSMLEDIWLPRGAGDKSTEVSMLDEGQQLGETEDVQYTRNTFYRSLNVPRSRFDSENANPFHGGRVTEITRDEYRFLKFIQACRNRFITLVEDVLRTELTLNGAIRDSEWREIRRDLTWVFAEDNQLTELKRVEVLESRLALAQNAEAFVETYLSRKWIAQNILKQTEAEIEELANQREEETPIEDNPDDNDNS